MYFKFNHLGLMQGRLVKSEKKNRIQYFPAKNWKKEIDLMNDVKINILEWTINRENAKNNPLIHNPFKIINFLKNKKIKVLSVTNDIFMQEPFFKSKNTKKMNLLLKELKIIIKNSGKVGAKNIVLPIVDNGSVTDSNQKKILIDRLKKIKLTKKDPNILFESDMSPKKLINFIECFDSNKFGINYDIGNSSYYNYNFNDEKKYFKYIKNVHLKDKNKNDKTVRLGTGQAKFKKIFSTLKEIEYNGNFILQTARSKSNNHIGEIKMNLNFLKKFFI